VDNFSLSACPVIVFAVSPAPLINADTTALMAATMPTAAILHTFAVEISALEVDCPDAATCCELCATAVPTCCAACAVPAAAVATSENDLVPAAPKFKTLLASAVN